MAKLLFEDVFEILKRDPDGKRFDKVSRYHARSDTYQMDLKLDINIDIYPLEVRQQKHLGTSTASLPTPSCNEAPPPPPSPPPAPHQNVP